MKKCWKNLKRKEKKNQAFVPKKQNKKKNPAVPTIAAGFRFFKMSNFTAEI